MFLVDWWTVVGVNKEEHGRRLKKAMAERGVDRQVVSDATGKGVRTVTNWTSGANMPSARERAQLVRLLGDYCADGDAVEVAVRGSALIKWRQDAVLTEYERHKYEQGREATG